MRSRNFMQLRKFLLRIRNRNSRSLCGGRDFICRRSFRIGYRSGCAFHVWGVCDRASTVHDRICNGLQSGGG